MVNNEVLKKGTAKEHVQTTYTCMYVRMEQKEFDHSNY